MKQTQRYISFVILCMQLITSVVSVHAHLEDLVLPTASPIHTLVSHKDADHCRHEPISQENFCLLCTMVRVSLQQSCTHTAPCIEKVAGIIPEQLIQFHLVVFTSSQSHRGPPLFSA